jgi:hypothetical protein
MKWFGKIAFSNQIEKEPGVWEDEPVLRDYYGDVLKNYKSNDSSSASNPDINISNQLSVVADPFLLNSFHKILYVTFMGAKWRVKSVDVQYPRMSFEFGGLYTEDEE